MPTPPSHAVTAPDAVSGILDITHHFMHGLYAKRIALDKGASFGKHTHDFSHISVVAKGVARVDVGGVWTDYGPGSFIEIQADIEHSVLALEDLVWFCVHVTDETDADKIDEKLTSGKL